MPEDELEIFMVGPNSDFSSLDGVIIPGPKSTMADMAYLEESGMADKIKDFAAQGGFVFGICGGYQILGQDLIDPLHIDGGG
ncbi:MAG: cobyric acid synthase CobQ, partial [Clostridiales bacterium]